MNHALLSLVLSLQVFILASAFTINPITNNNIGLSKCISVCSSSDSCSARNSRSHSSSLKMSTWSDSKAVMDYQNFLSSGRQEPESKKDGPSVIIKSSTQGFSDLADSLAIMGMGDDVVLTPYQSLPTTLGESSEYPIYITLPPTEIEDFIRNLPPEYEDRNEDFVFFSGGLQYGNIEDLLKNFGYCRDSMTQVLGTGFRLTAAKRVMDISVQLGLDSNGEQKYAGECTACGKWNGAIASRMERNNIRCRQDFYREWRRHMWERSVYDALFHLLGSVRTESTTLSDVANYYNEEVGDMIWELSGLLRGWKALTLTYGFEERIYGIAEGTGDGQQCTLIDHMYPFIWGNHVYLQSKTFLEYLHYAQKESRLLQSVALPPISDDDDFQSKMRKGNLRADGVI